MGMIIFVYLHALRQVIPSAPNPRHQTPTALLINDNDKNKPQTPDHAL